MSFYEDIANFHNKFQLGYDGKPRQLDPRLSSFRTVFMHEELVEYQQAYVGLLEAQRLDDGEARVRELSRQLDALVDLTYVVLGTAHMHGFDFNEAWARVHRANMAKQRVERFQDSKRGSTFDVIKPDGWTAPDLTDLVR